jgi:hypothetical protein
MQPIVDFRLGDVYRPRSSSHLIYTGSRHTPGMRSSLRWRGQQGGVAGVESRRAFGRSLMSSGGPPHFLPSSESV